MNKKQKIIYCLLILLIGGLGGIIADCFILPNLANISWFSNVGFIQRIKNRTTIINKTEEIIITENIAIEQAIDKIKPCLVVVQVYQNNRLIIENSGFILTNDGLIVTAYDSASPKADKIKIIFSDGYSTEAQKIKQDKDGLVLLKIDMNNLPVAALSDLSDLYLGQRIVIIGAQISQGRFNHFVNIGTIRGISKGVLSLNVDESNSSANGGPLVDIKGGVLGLNIIDNFGLVKTIPADNIKNLLAL